jgi:hypothetical protein
MDARVRKGRCRNLKLFVEAAFVDFCHGSRVPMSERMKKSWMDRMEVV